MVTDGLRAFVIFIGYPRSGHSLVGSLLNAHPQLVVSHELDVLERIEAGISRGALLAEVIARDRQFAATGRRWAGYDYSVPGAWQGRWTSLYAVGDKKGGGSSRRLLHSPQLLDRLADCVQLPLRVLHVVRSPLNNVASIVARSRHAENPAAIGRAVRFYSRLARSVDRARARLEADQVLDLWHEQTVTDPRAALESAATHIGVPAPTAWLDACARVVQPRPSQPHERVAWTPRSRDALRECIHRFPWLRRYAAEH